MWVLKKNVDEGRKQESFSVGPFSMSPRTAGLCRAHCQIFSEPQDFPIFCHLFNL